MNSIRVKDKLQRAWLKVRKMGASSNPGHSTLRGELFDGQSFEFVVPDYDFESQSDGTVLIEVGLVGSVGNIPTSKICEVILPAPVLSLGHNIRVSEGDLVKWEVYRLIQEKNEAAKGGQ